MQYTRNGIKYFLGVLIGASVGGVCVLVILLAVLIWCRFSGYGCRRSRRPKVTVKLLVKTLLDQVIMVTSGKNKMTFLGV